jgi:ketosteroid isomerase-like protein
MEEQEAANVVVVKQFYAYLANGDRDGAYAHCMADDCVLHEAASLPYGGVYAGRDLMKSTLSGVTGSFDNFTYEIPNYLAGGDEVVVHL